MALLLKSKIAIFPALQKPTHMNNKRVEYVQGMKENTIWFYYQSHGLETQRHPILEKIFSKIHRLYAIYRHA